MHSALPIGHCALAMHIGISYWKKIQSVWFFAEMSYQNKTNTANITLNRHTGDTITSQLF